MYAIHSLSTDRLFRLLVAYFVCCDRYVPDGVCQSASYIFLDGYVSNDGFLHRCLIVCDKPWQSIKLFEARSLPIFYFEIISWEEIPSLSEAFYSKNISSVLSRCSYLLSGSRLDRLGIGSYSPRSCELALLWLNNHVSYIWRNRICPKSVRGGNESWLPLFLIAKWLFF